MPRVFLHSLRHAVKGLRTVWREERNFRIQIIVAVVVIAAAYALGIPATHGMIILLTILLVLGAEILNTFAEDLLNKIEPKHDPLVGKLKDMMAGMVLLQSVGALIIGMLMLTSLSG